MHLNSAMVKLQAVKESMDELAIGLGQCGVAQKWKCSRQPDVEVWHRQWSLGYGARWGLLLACRQGH